MKAFDRYDSTFGGSKDFHWWTSYANPGMWFVMPRSASGYYAVQDDFGNLVEVAL